VIVHGIMRIGKREGGLEKKRDWNITYDGSGAGGVTVRASTHNRDACRSLCPSFAGRRTWRGYH
jgi:hypothetical protein